jgi:hypothetical protein
MLPAALREIACRVRKFGSRRASVLFGQTTKTQGERSTRLNATCENQITARSWGFCSQKDLRKDLHPNLGTTREQKHPGVP